MVTNMRGDLLNSAAGDFDFNLFCSLAGGALVEYMEPLLARSDFNVSRDSLVQLASHFHSFDEYHLVYAIELGVSRLPQVFASLAASSLSHTSQSVRLAAHRNLLSLPEHMITSEVIDQCERALKLRGAKDDVSDIAIRLRERHRIGGDITTP
jgi:hypothetical protein